MNDIERISNCTTGLKLLCEKYQVYHSGWTIKQQCCDTLVNMLEVGNGKNVPLLFWRSEPRFQALKGCTTDGTLKDISAVKIFRIDRRNVDIRSLMYKELDLCLWLVDPEVDYIYSVANGQKAINMVVRLKSGVVCTIEIAATLANDAQPIDKHEVISSRGVAVDKVVDTQITQNSVYIYTDSKDPDVYTDIDLELYGLETSDVALVHSALDILRENVCSDELIKRDKMLRKLVAMALKSAETSKKITLEDICQ